MTLDEWYMVSILAAAYSFVGMFIKTIALPFFEKVFDNLFPKKLIIN